MLAKWLGFAIGALCIAPVLTAELGAAELSPAQRTLLDGFSAHRRVAIGYLRTGNAELGAIEIERLRDRWAKDLRALGSVDASLGAALAAADQDVREGLAAVDRGDMDAARVSMERAAAPLRAWRQENGVRMFSDCIGEVGAVYERLDAYRGASSFADTAQNDAIAKAATATETALQRCDREAEPGTKADADFRRLIDGFLNSLRQIPDVLRNNDAGYFHRLIIEQRSFERLLSFRYG